MVDTNKEEIEKSLVPDFEKYDGKACPYTDLKVYCGDMFQLGSDEKLLVQLFQKSLTGSAVVHVAGPK